MDDRAPAHSPRWYVTIAILRGLLTTVVVLALYYTLPLDLDGATSAALRVLVGCVAFVAVMTWQVPAVKTSTTPGLRAIDAGFLVAPLFLVMFAALYYVMGQNDASTFSEDLSRSDALYFTITTFATVGFGDITPKGETARLVVATQMIFDLVLLGLGVRVLLNAVERGRERLTAPTSAE